MKPLFAPVRIAGVELQVPLALGTMMWGFTAIDAKLAGKRGVLANEAVAKILGAARDNHVELVDTAEGYGYGTSEERVGMLRDQLPGMVVSTKFFPGIWRFTQKQFDDALEGCARRLKQDVLDIYYIHTPVHWLPVEFFVRCLARAKERGKVKAIGVSNFSAEQLRAAIRAAAPTKIDTVQVQYSLLCSAGPELERMLQICREHGIVVLGFSPVAQGLLVDGMTDETFQGSRIRRVTGLTRALLDPLRAEIGAIAKERGVSMAQIAVNHSACKGIVPLVGVRTEGHVREAAAALTKFRLTDAEVARLDAVALPLSTFDRPSKRRWVSIILLTVVVFVYKVEGMLWRLGLVQRPQL